MVLRAHCSSSIWCMNGLGSSGGMILTADNRRTRRKTCLSTSFFSTNPTELTWARTRTQTARSILHTKVGLETHFEEFVQVPVLKSTVMILSILQGSFVSVINFNYKVLSAFVIKVTIFRLSVGSFKTRVITATELIYRAAWLIYDSPFSLKDLKIIYYENISRIMELPLRSLN